VIVTAYDIEARKPVFMRSAKDDLLMRDVARATAAAPTDDTLLVSLGTASLTISNLERQGRALIDAEREAR
jgi:hypothetical protein